MGTLITYNKPTEVKQLHLSLQAVTELCNDSYFQPTVADVRETSL